MTAAGGFRPAKRLTSGRALLSKQRLAVEYGVVTLLLFAAGVLLQLRTGAYSAEFGDDEASHYISGLLIHDYFVDGLGQSPVEFLKRFHSHYPLVGIGHWPPLYYFVEAVWMLLFSWGRGSMLALSAVVTCATAAACFVFLRSKIGLLVSLFVAFAFVASPVVQRGSSELMLDVPVALLCLASMICYVRYLDSGHGRYSLAFGVIAAAALLVKGNAAALALLPPLAILIACRFDLLRRVSFWLPVPIVAAIAGPWYVLTYGLVTPGFRYAWGSGYFLTAAAANTAILLDAVGPMVLGVAAVGFAIVVVAPRTGLAANERVVAAALLAAVWMFQSIVPAAIQDRYLIPALPPLLILAAATVRFLCQAASESLSTGRSAFRSAEGLTTASVAIMAISMVPSALADETKPSLGLIEAAAQILGHRTDRNPSVLLVTDGQDEAAAIAELAMIDPNRPGIFAIRGSRLLGGGGYNNQDYVARFQTPEQVMAAIDDYAIPLVLYRARGTPQEWAHLQQVNAARELQTERWELIYDDERASPPVLLFRIRDNDEKAADTARLTALSAPRALAP